MELNGWGVLLIQERQNVDSGARRLLYKVSVASVGNLRLDNLGSFALLLLLNRSPLVLSRSAGSVPEVTSAALILCANSPRLDANRDSDRTLFAGRAVLGKDRISDETTRSVSSLTLTGSNLMCVSSRSCWFVGCDNCERSLSTEDLGRGTASSKLLTDAGLEIASCSRRTSSSFDTRGVKVVGIRYDVLLGVSPVG
jgi:hypothetical protein